MKKTIYAILIIIIFGVFVVNDFAVDDFFYKSNDYEEDNLVLVNKDNPLPSNFKASNLVNLSDMQLYNYEIKTPNIKINKEVYEKMNEMFKKAYEDGVTGFVITSGYRTKEEQAKIYDSTNDGTAAKVNESEHQTGLAFDVKSSDGIVFGATPQFLWLQSNCAEYGFILRYPSGKEDITGYPYESWHYRYVGKENAIEIMEKGITLEEYLN